MKKSINRNKSLQSFKKTKLNCQQLSLTKGGCCDEPPHDPPPPKEDDDNNNGE